MADQIPSGTGQKENSDQIPDVSATQKNLCDQATTEFVGYIHNLSPLKKGSYFDCQLQGKEKTVQGVCFLPPKLKRFTSLSEANSQVKIKKFRIDTKSNAEDLLIGHDVTIEHFPAIDFDKVKLPTTMNLSTIKSVCPGQIVTVTAQVTHLYPSKTVGSKNLQIQQAIIADPSGTMKMTLWENFVGSIKQGDTYTFRDICVYKDKMSHEICLNTAKSGSTVESAPQFQQVLPFTVLESTTVNGKIIGVNQVASYLSCCKCNKKVNPRPEHAFIECAKCHFKQKQTASKAHWFAQVLFQDTNDDKIDFTLFEDAIHQIAKLTSDTIEVKGLTQADIESTLFASPPICITYHRRSKVVENVSQ